MTQTVTKKTCPSARWTSFENWDYDGMKERLETALATIDKDKILHHAQQVKGQTLTMSDNFSAGQFWIFFEMVAEDDSLVIARVRLPRHPDTLPTNLPYLNITEVYAYEGPNSERAIAAGAIYILLEGFYGNTLLDVEFDICSLPPILGRLSTAAADGLIPQGPFSTTGEYFTAIGEAALRKGELEEENGNDDLTGTGKLGAYVSLDIVPKTDLFKGLDSGFYFNHMDLGTQNIIVDDDFNFLGLIDWEFAQTAPWQVNHYPMPFPLFRLTESIMSILADPDHIAHENIKKQQSSRNLYCQKFQEAEGNLWDEGHKDINFSGVLEGPASRVLSCFNQVGESPENESELAGIMARLAFGFDDESADSYLQDIESQIHAGTIGLPQKMKRQEVVLAIYIHLHLPAFIQYSMLSLMVNACVALDIQTLKVNHLKIKIAQ
ncbi:hypothetical protein N7488_005244 [Penicillium malachiteum]|nr:hypothetical protein N7488_005244 [Penicillium malachiteum]